MAIKIFKLTAVRDTHLGLIAVSADRHIYMEADETEPPDLGADWTIAATLDPEPT